jgi:CheY-like chemotaxis protein
LEIKRNSKLHRIKVILSSSKLAFPHDWWKQAGEQSIANFWMENVAKPYKIEQMLAAVNRAVNDQLPKELLANSSASRTIADDALPTSIPMSEGKVNILVVEDDNVGGPAILEKLRGKGYGVGWCMNRRTMDEFIKPGDGKLPFHILILDLALPDAMGSDILKDLAKDPRSHGVQVIIVTGSLAQGEEASYKSQLDPDARALLSEIMIKPYKLDELAKAVQRAVEKKASVA